ncbi:MAG: response regulator [Flavobacteriales bacterium]|nr:response regulator [Flavobacteriales bacterium]
MNTHHAVILIVEDEPLIAEDLASMLSELGHLVHGRAHDACTALHAVQVERPDLVLLDIRLNAGPDGIAIAKELQNIGVPFVFVTSHADDSTLQRASETRPEGYIVKPFELEDLRAQLAIVFARLDHRTGTTRTPGTFLVRDRGALVKLQIDAIHYVEADDNYCTIYTEDKRYVVASSLSALEERLCSQHLVRVHRSYLVDLRLITSLRERELQLGDRVLPVGRTHRKELLRRWSER